MEKNKKCSKCGEVKALEGFSRSYGNLDGHHNQCKACRLEYMKAYNLRNYLPVVQKGPVVADGMKHCSKCGETKDKSEFGKKAESFDGLQGSCRSCTAAYYRAHRAASKANRPPKEVVPSVAAGFKWCRTCQQELKVSRFSLNKKLRDGLEHHCRTCLSKRQSELKRLRRIQPAGNPVQELQQLQSLAQRHVELLDEGKAEENQKLVADFAADLWVEVQAHFMLNPPLLPAHKLLPARQRLNALVAQKTYGWWRVRFDGLKMGHWLELLVPGYRHYTVNPFHDRVAA